MEQKFYKGITTDLVIHFDKKKHTDTQYRVSIILDLLNGEIPDYLKKDGTINKLTIAQSLDFIKEHTVEIFNDEISRIILDNSGKYLQD